MGSYRKQNIGRASEEGHPRTLLWARALCGVSKNPSPPQRFFEARGPSAMTHEQSSSEKSLCDSPNGSKAAAGIWP